MILDLNKRKSGANERGSAEGDLGEVIKITKTTKMKIRIRLKTKIKIKMRMRKRMKMKMMITLMLIMLIWKTEKWKRNQKGKQRVSRDQVLQ